MVMGVPLSYGRQLINMSMWIPAFILFGYPLVYFAIPHLLLKGKVVEFFLVTLAWGVAGLYIDAGYRSYVLIPLQEAMNLKNILPRGPLAFCYLCMTTSAASRHILTHALQCVEIPDGSHCICRESGRHFRRIGKA